MNAKMQLILTRSLRRRVSTQPVYRGWLLTWLLGPTQLVTWGIVYYTFSVILAPMRAEMGWSNAEVTGAFSLALLASGVSSVFVGRRLDQHGPRAMMLMGVALAIALVVVWSQVRSLPILYAAWLGLGLLMPAILYDPALWVITRWFIGEHSRERGRALTVLTFFGGLASTAFIPLTTVLQLNLGWRNALLVLAGVLALSVLLPYYFGLEGTPPTVAPSTQPHTPAPATPMPVNRSTFWLLTIPLALTGMAWSAMSVHLFSWALSRGQAAAYIAFAASLVGVMQVVGRLVLVPLSGRVSSKRLTMVLCCIQALAIASLLVLPPSVGLIGYAVCFGVGHGVMTPLRATLIADTFGTGNFGSIAGQMALVTTVARAAAPVAVGIAIVSWGGYSVVLLVVCAASLLAAVVLLRL